MRRCRRDGVATFEIVSGPGGTPVTLPGLKGPEGVAAPLKILSALVENVGVLRFSRAGCRALGQGMVSQCWLGHVGFLR